MKKFLTLLLTAAMTLSLAACGSKNDGNANGGDSQPADALALLNTVWSSNADDDKFAVVGGDYDEANMTEDAPGRFGVEDGDTLDSMLGFPAADADKLADAASLSHMMNANTFTCGAFHVANADDVSSIAEDIHSEISGKHWMCGFPDKMFLATNGNLIVSVYGNEDLVNTFRDKLFAADAGFTSVYDEAISA